MLGHMGHVGQMGQMGFLGRLDQMGHLGTDKPYDEEKMAHCMSTSFGCAVKFRIRKAVSTKC